MPDNHVSPFVLAKERRAKELEKEFSYKGYQVVKRELFAHQRDPAVVIRRDSIAFNAACIRGFENVVYIHVLINPNTHRMVIKKCSEDDKNALRWCVVRPEKRVSRKISGKPFSSMLYKLLEWNIECRYKILGYRISVDNEPIYIFDLSESEVFDDRRKLSEGTDESSSRDKKITVADNSRITANFGVSLEENEQALQVCLGDYQSAD